jgi:hypothetical protein
MNKRYLRLATSIAASTVLVGSLLALAPQLPARADTVVVLSGGSRMAGTLTFDFGTVTLTGVQQTASGTLTLSGVGDATGSGDGWNVTLWLSQLTDGSNTFPLGSIVTQAGAQLGPVSGCNGTCGSTTTITKVGAAQTLDPQTGASGAVTLLDAQAGDGMGTYNFTDTVTLSIPADAHATTYTSSANLSINDGP